MWRRWFFLLIFNAYIFLRMNLLVCYVYFHYMTDRHTHIYLINVYLKPMFTDRWAVGLFIPCLGKLFSAELLRISKQITDSFQQKSSLPLSYLSFQLISTNPFKPFQIQITLKLPSFVHVIKSISCLGFIRCDFVSRPLLIIAQNFIQYVSSN